MQQFIAVKVLDRKWAEKLLDGEVFMRPLSEFGTWDKSSEIQDKNRRDIMEGAVATYKDTKLVQELKGIDPRFEKLIYNVTMIDETDLQYFKIFCMYCLEKESDSNRLIPPDTRIRGFGNTAVVIRDLDEFLIRWGKAVIKKYKQSIELIDRIHYFNLEENRKLNPMFEKVSSYAYQKELRLAVAELEFDEFAIGPTNGKDYRIVLDKNRVILNIGSIRDIAYAIQTSSLIDTTGIFGQFRNVTNNPPLKPTVFDDLVGSTRARMKEYRPIAVRQIITIAGEGNIKEAAKFKAGTEQQ